MLPCETFHVVSVQRSLKLRPFDVNSMKILHTKYFSLGVPTLVNAEVSDVHVSAEDFNGALSKCVDGNGDGQY
jgi:hypothetical protein